MSNLITTEYLQGYVAALNNIKEALQEFMDTEEKLLAEFKSDYNAFDLRTSAFEQVEQYVESVKQSYKELVKQLNEKK